MRELAGRDVALVADETGDAKSSTGCVGAGRRYFGAIKGVGLCQVAVHLAAVAEPAWGVIDRTLYLPKGRVADEERRTVAGVPEEVVFATKSEQAVTMVKNALERGVRARRQGHPGTRLGPGGRPRGRHPGRARGPLHNPGRFSQSNDFGHAPSPPHVRQSRSSGATRAVGVNDERPWQPTRMADGHGRARPCETDRAAWRTAATAGLSRCSDVQARAEVHGGRPSTST